MSSTDIKEFSERVITTPNEKVLPISLIFGANASGKTSFVSAFSFMKNCVLKSNDSTVLDISSEQERMFEVYLLDSQTGLIYNYGFVIARDEVREEWLNMTNGSITETVFYRNQKKLELPVISIRNADIKRINYTSDSLILSYVYDIDNSALEFVYNWFEKLEIVKLKGSKSGKILESLKRFLKYNPQEIERVNAYLRAFDPKTSINLADRGSKTNISFIHQVNNSEIKVSLEDESSGLYNLLLLYYPLYCALNTGALLVVDDLDMNLHPLALRNFLLPFLNAYTNPKNAQIILTLHNTFMISKEFLRRDEIWFTEKNERGVASLYSLADIVDNEEKMVSNRRDYEKDYLIDRFGAVPKLENFYLIK